MTLRIERVPGRRIRLSGQFRSEHLDQVKAEIDRCGASAVVDLEELDLVDVEGIRFLNECEAKGISVDNLRIADGSIMPRVTSGNTMAPCVIIGERAAEIIRTQHQIATTSVSQPERLVEVDSRHFS